jgi:hypothetical protein
MKSAIQGCHKGYNLKSSADCFNLAIVKLDGIIARFEFLAGESVPSIVAATLTRFMFLKALYRL